VLLIYISYLDALPYLKCARIRLLVTHYQPEKCGFAGTVGTDDSHNTCRRQLKAQILKKYLVSVCLTHSLKFDYLITQTRTIGNKYLEPLFLLSSIFAK